MPGYDAGVLCVYRACLSVSTGHVCLCLHGVSVYVYRRVARPIDPQHLLPDWLFFAFFHILSVRQPPSAAAMHESQHSSTDL